MAENHPAIMQFLTVFVSSLPEACKTQFGIEVKNGSPKPADWKAFKNRAAVVADIGVTGGPISGNVLLGFPKDTFLKGATAVLGEEFTEIDAGNLDFGGEILNIVYGVAKAKLKDQHNLPVLPAIPKVLLIENFNLQEIAGPTIEICYQSDWGEFWCLFRLKSDQSVAA